MGKFLELAQPKESRLISITEGMFNDFLLCSQQSALKFFDSDQLEVALQITIIKLSAAKQQPTRQTNYSRGELGGKSNVQFLCCFDVS